MSLTDWVVFDLTQTFLSELVDIVVSENNSLKYASLSLPILLSSPL